MRLIKKYKEARRLVHVRVLYDGHRGWTFSWDNNSVFKVFYGSREDFIKLLIKLQAKENKDTQRSVRTVRYSDIADDIMNGVDTRFWVWETQLRGI